MVFYRRKKKNIFSRIIFLGIIFFILWGMILLRLAKLQIIDWQKYQSLAQEMRTFEKERESERGEIFVREGNEMIPIAINIYSYNLYAKPNEIKDPVGTARLIAESLKIPIQETNNDFQEILKKVSKKNDWYEILKKGLSQEEVDEIKTKKIKGIDFEKKIERFYPEGRYFSHLLGFVGFKGEKKEGRYGLEEYYENILSGKEGLIKGEKGIGGVLIPSGKTIFKEAKNGANLILTINRTIQIKTCEILTKAIEKYQAESGNIIVVDPKTGEIISLCNWPTFDPNRYNEVKEISIFSNRAISSQFEPGSVFKTITFAAALEEGKITPELTYEDKGVLKIGGRTIKNAAGKVYGRRTMREVLEKSINTGAVFVAQKIGLDKFREYVEKFGFGEKTGIDLVGEIKGDIKNLSKKEEIYLATASFGQGIAVTPLQMVMSFAAIANQGKLMKPYLVKEIISDDYYFKNEPKEIRQVISPKTAEILKNLLISVVKNGWGKRAGVKGYLVAGKTGTAEVPQSKGYSSSTIHSFAGFAPADDPKFVAFVKLDNPKLGKFSDRTAAPTFGELADFILKYYKIPPTEE
ncbi:MAG: peptidoglycan D,D-transpeptidase FtsI family protein [Patescibacteria group bacterium]